MGQPDTKGKFRGKAPLLMSQQNTEPQPHEASGSRLHITRYLQGPEEQVKHHLATSQTTPKAGPSTEQGAASSTGPHLANTRQEAWSLQIKRQMSSLVARGLKIQCCHCSVLGRCCGTGSIPGLGTSTWVQQKKKKDKKKKQPNGTYGP